MKTEKVVQKSILYGVLMVCAVHVTFVMIPDGHDNNIVTDLIIPQGAVWATAMAIWLGFIFQDIDSTNENQYVAAHFLRKLERRAMEPTVKDLLRNRLLGMNQSVSSVDIIDFYEMAIEYVDTHAVDVSRYEASEAAVTAFKLFRDDLDHT